MKDFYKFESDEKKAANIARAALKSSLINQIKRTFHRGKTGKLLKESNVNSRFVLGRLDRLVLNSPRYSFQSNFGSTKSGFQKSGSRRGGSVKSFVRHLDGKKIEVHSHDRQGTTVAAFDKNIRYKTRNHISRALKQTKALENLATALGENRIVLISSQIDF